MNAPRNWMPAYPSEAERYEKRDWEGKEMLRITRTMPICILSNTWA